MKTNLTINGAVTNIISTIISGLNSLNEQYGVKHEAEPLTLSLTNENGDIIGGLSGQKEFKWLNIKLLWVSDEYRGKGNGKKLMIEAETWAKERELTGITVSTFDYQSPEFYLKLGFKEHGRLLDFPHNGHKRIYLAKKL